MNKLSDLMRQGSQLRPQAFRDYVQRGDEGEVCTCAIGAAYEAITGKLPPSQNEDYDACPMVNREIERETGIALGFYSTKNPVTHNWETLTGLISGLNDAHKWTREEIADWLEQEGL